MAVFMKHLKSLALLVIIMLGGYVGGKWAAIEAVSFAAPSMLVRGDYSAHFRSSSAPLILYATSTCPWCKKTRTWLEQNHVSYELRLIDQNPAEQKSFQSLRQAGVPVLISKDRLLDGFNEKLLSAWLRP
jgi:mycoredoxin